MTEATATALKIQFRRLLVRLSILSALIVSNRLMLAQEPNQKVFHSAEEASAALFAAAQQSGDRALLEILGPAGKDLITSGDPAEDMKERETFVTKYEQMHRAVKERDGVIILYIGAENWPSPIPLVEKNGVWYFDTSAGNEEVLARRVGRNELAAIDVCYQLVDAQRKQYAKATDGQHRFALRLSGDKDDGRDSLFPSGDERQSSNPGGAPIHFASAEHGTSEPRDSGPINGYYFRILTAQGPNAAGGAQSYIVNGKMVTGFAFIAYPAAYRSTGVTTFIVNQDGVVYQKDLGPDTKKMGIAMTEYDPDSTWERVK